jgi:two-component system, OmpR family, phosphate regulon sensor histidine kinase PhoR
MIDQLAGNFRRLLRRLRSALDVTQVRLTAPTAVTGDKDGVTHPGRCDGSREMPVWRSMRDGIHDPALVLDGALVAMASNGAAHDAMSIAMGRHLAQTSQSPELLTAAERALATGEAQVFDVRLLVPVKRLLSGQVTPLRPRSLSDITAPALLLVLRDLTEQDQLARLRADFVANASHELRTPLASLKGHVETLQRAAKDDAVARAKFLPIMQAEADRMSRLIEDLLSLSRIEMREHVPPFNVVDLVSVVAEVATTLDPLAAAAGQSIMMASMPGHARVTGDRDELLQVALNLIQNAIKYGKPSGKIGVSVRDLGAHWSLSIADDGIGIAAQHLPRLTERFYRVSAKDSRERGGTGLGLAIVKHIVNRHRGELKITSVLGKGSEFVVLLPRA